MSDRQRRRRELLKSIWCKAVSAVSGRQVVVDNLMLDEAFSPDLIVAVGKAAVGMCKGAREIYADCPALVVTKYEHSKGEFADSANSKGIEIIESSHPTPDENSLLAGERLLQSVGAMPTDSRLLLLISGGASSLAEVLPAGIDLKQLQIKNDAMLATGMAIDEINLQRKQVSRIKDGKLLEVFTGKQVRVYAISDVEGDSISVIGSGIGDTQRCRAKSAVKIIASNRIARDRAAIEAQSLGLKVRYNQETLYGDIFEHCAWLQEQLADAVAGLYIYGGEPTVVLPPNPGCGGRNQSLALALAEIIADRDDITILVAGTDGSDGPTEAAGGLIDGSSWGQGADARQALQGADAGTYLNAIGNLFATGPTHTNVMDIMLVLID